MIQAIWPLYRANDCSNFALPQGVSIEDAKEYMLKSALEQLHLYDEIDKKLNGLATEWGSGKEEAELFIWRAKDIQKELGAIPLKLKLAETYELQTQDMINIFSKKYE